MSTETPEQLIEISHQFEAAWNRYVNLTLISFIAASVICLIVWALEIRKVDYELAFGLPLLVGCLVVVFKRPTCPRCKHSLLEFRPTQNPAIAQAAE